MSHIFDALQKSVGEDSSIELPSALLATQVLEATERKTAAERASVATLEEPSLPAEIAAIAGIKQSLDAALSRREARETVASPEIAIARSGVDQLSQFHSLKVLVPPQSRVVCLTDKDSLGAEKFRFLGVRLRQLQQTRPLKKILITSTIPQEGKSMVAANLACALAQRTHQKTLLIDGDLRRPSVAKLFGFGKLSGIADWLQGEHAPMNCIYHLEEAGIWVLPAGNAPRNPLELMQSGRLLPLMEQLTSLFDWIVIDSPPVLPLADTSIWMRQADGILLVARQGATEKDQLRRGIEVIDQKKLLGAVLNSSENVAQSNHYYQYTQTAETAESLDNHRNE
jgi:capsular exopolysaccharide synthesis family protein